MNGIERARVFWVMRRTRFDTGDIEMTILGIVALSAVIAIGVMAALTTMP